MTTESDWKAVAYESSSIAPVAAQEATNTQAASTAPLPGYTFPVNRFAKAKSWAATDGQPRPMPHIIAHRGFKARFPENSLVAFQEAVKAGATALETDVHLTKDHVVVLSHDADLKRFGHAEKILDWTWEEIQELRTRDAPHVPMLCFQELLKFLEEPGRTNIWLLLDIKADNRSENIMRRIQSTIKSVPPRSGQQWEQRILLGVWAARQVPFAAEFLPGFSAVHIGYHLGHAKRNVSAPHIGVVLLVHTMLAPGGRQFVEECTAKPGAGPVIAWPVNDQDKTEWCVRRSLDGLVTDDPEMMAKVLGAFDVGAEEPKVPLSCAGYLRVLFVYCWINSMFWLFNKTTHLEYEPPETDSNNKRKQN